MKKIPMLEKFAAQSLVEYEGELIFSKEKFAELIVRECAQEFDNTYMSGGKTMGAYIREKFGVES